MWKLLQQNLTKTPKTKILLVCLLTLESVRNISTRQKPSIFHIFQRNSLTGLNDKLVLFRTSQKQTFQSETKKIKLKN